MTCVKKTVIAVLIAPNGKEYVGMNAALYPQESCPRVGDAYRHEDYTLCKTVCGQRNHAEADAIEKAGSDARGSTLYVAHHRVCTNCQRIIEEAGVLRVICI
jgi:deoxycytidylate deaminase